MKVVIIEDEIAATKNLKAILDETAPDTKLIAVLDSVKSAVQYFKESEIPDIIFADIQLADGNSFSIFKEIEITCPVIFTTAYDSYALEAFKVNGIDYLLKPIQPDQVLKALNKLRLFSKVETDKYTVNINNLIKNHKQYNRTLLVNFKDRLIPVSVNEIAYFYTSENKTLLKTFDNKELNIDKTLETVMANLNPSDFFRANRQFIISHKAIKEVVIWFGNRLSVSLCVSVPERIIISKARVSLFKKWVQGKQI